MARSSDKTDFEGNLRNPYKTQDDGVIDFTAYDSQPGVVESGAVSQKDFDAARSNSSGSPSAMNSGSVGAAQTIAKGGTADQAVEAGLIGSGNPYAVAAGLGLSAFSANQRAKQAAAQRQYDANLATQKRMIASTKEGVSAWDRMRNLV